MAGAVELAGIEAEVSEDGVILEWTVWIESFWRPDIDVTHPAKAADRVSRKETVGNACGKGSAYLEPKVKGLIGAASTQREGEIVQGLLPSIEERRCIKIGAARDLRSE